MREDEGAGRGARCHSLLCLKHFIQALFASSRTAGTRDGTYLLGLEGKWWVVLGLFAGR